MSKRGYGQLEVPTFGRAFFGPGHVFSRIGSGELGGKAKGLVLIREVLDTRLGCSPAGIDVEIPKATVLTTEIFDLYMQRNDLGEVAFSDLPDERIAHAFQRAELPLEVTGDLHALIENVRVPLAIRSSSLLEDALFRPFAGVYATKMIPNNEADAATRFRRLVEGIKYVYASTFFAAAKNYIRATDKRIEEEKMAVLLQEVVGTRHDQRFYPDVSGVARSYNFYPMTGARPDEGIVNLALGLGKTIVDGGVTWCFAPSRPLAPPPFASPADGLRNTQLQFWAVNMGKPPAYDPIAETEYLVELDLSAADYDGTLALLASTYDPRADRLVPGVGRDGPRVLTFAPLLQSSEYALDGVVRDLLSLCKEALDLEVETEFALTLPPPRTSGAARLGFLQVRPMVVSDEKVEISEVEWHSENVLLASTRVMGNGSIDALHDVVYVLPESFSSLATRKIAAELGKLNRQLLDSGTPFLLIGFGRWGSSDPALGIPVDWGQICGARAIVEATLPGMNVEPSQGSHFFHNINSFQVSYFQVHHESDHPIDWQWLNAQPAATESEWLRHVRLERPLLVKVDGMSGRGAVWYR